MKINVKNTKLFNFYIGMAKRIVNRRDAMGNPLLGYVRLSADMHRSRSNRMTSYQESSSMFPHRNWMLRFLKMDLFFFPNPFVTGSKEQRRK